MTGIRDKTYIHTHTHTYIFTLIVWHKKTLNEIEIAIRKELES